jgi:dTDP-4-amino-4,6-dideoxygalactose transaminase
MDTPRLNRQMPVFPTRRPEVLAAAQRHLASSDWVRLEGPLELERDLVQWHGPSGDGRDASVFAVSSGTAALMAMLLGHEIGEGDEVITTPYTWGATVSAVLAVGAIPVFADVDRLTGLIDPVAVDALVTPRTRAVLCVHLFGQSCDMDALRAVADRHRVLLLEDGSQAHGARWRGRPAGTFGDAAAFSCMGLKMLAGTELGYAVFRDARAAERAWLYGRHPRGYTPGTADRLGGADLLDALQLGWRPCSVAAELVRAALPYLDMEAAARRRNLARLCRHLDGCDGLVVPPEPATAEGVPHLLSLVHHDDRTGRTRAEIAQRLSDGGVWNMHYIPTPIHRARRMLHKGYHGPRVLWHGHLERAGVDYARVSCPNAEWRAQREITLGFNWTVDDPEAMAQLAAVIRWASAPG